MPDLVTIGIGLDGWNGLKSSARNHFQTVDLIIGSDRHLALIPKSASHCDRWSLGGISSTFDRLGEWIAGRSPVASKVIILASGDPLFFGIGRLLLERFPAEWLTFLPDLSAVQLAFAAIKQPWQDATVVSLHGRSPEELVKAVRRGDRKIALLTDDVHTPGAIAALIHHQLPVEGYRLWLCENLGGGDEAVLRWDLMPGGDFSALQLLTVAPLNVVILQRLDREPLAPKELPILGIADGEFFGFRDRPGLITKREIRTLILGALQLQTDHIIWDIGAGTGSVAIEIARLCPKGMVYAVEKSAAGIELIHKNAERFDVENIEIIGGEASGKLGDLPSPHRIFIGGSGGELCRILDCCLQKLLPTGKVVVALATMERTQELQIWHRKTRQNSSLKGTVLSLEWTQFSVARSVPVGPLTRWSPLNPVTLATFEWRSLQAE
ncbi:MAG: precorrin-6y C5,15-methyltransferase (decarboxylating) subunit CbiE [Cyanobacteria bacterium P01_D01_bin.73]